MEINEGGDNSYTVRLHREPTGSVTVDITGQANTDLSLDETSLTFTTTDWNVAQTVTVTAEQDDDAMDDTATLLHTASGANYGGVQGNVAVTVKDDDTPGLELSVSSLAIEEGGSKGYTVALATRPAANVAVTITGYANTDLSLDKTSLAFTTTDWNVAQTVTVTAEQDDDPSDDTATLVHTADASYGSVSADVSVTVTDDDKRKLVISSSALEINEGGDNSYTVRLDSKPTGTVTVDITGRVVNSYLSLDKTSLTFTTTDWNVAQTVTVTAEQDDNTVDHTETLLHTASGANYGGVQGNVVVTVKDDDTPGLDLSVQNLVINEGEMGSYTIRLATQPVRDVSVTITGQTNTGSLPFEKTRSLDEHTTHVDISGQIQTEFTLNHTNLTFTYENWNIPKTVEVTIPEDLDWTSEILSLTHTASGLDYENVSADVSVNLVDNETAPSPPHAYLFQRVHSFFESVSLIAGESATLRIFPTATTSTTITIPRAVATFYLDNTAVHTASIAAKNHPIPTQVWPELLDRSLNANIPATVIEPGLEMVIEIDPDDTVPDNLGVTKRIPASGRRSINVVTVPEFKLVFVPLVTSGQPGGDAVVATAQAMATNPDTHTLLSDVRTFLPIKDISATVHATVTTSSRDAYDLLDEVIAAHSLATDKSGYWMGLHIRPRRRVAGLARLNGIYSVVTLSSGTIAHELGHNLSLLHAPCGNPSFLDPNYPHDGGLIGSWGYDSNTLYAPDTHADVMSYCDPDWISDYHFNKLLGYYASSSEFSVSKEPPLATPPSGPSLLLWGGIDADSSPHLRPIFVVEATPSLPEAPGPWQLVGRASNGDDLFHLTFAMPVISDGDGSSSFAFVVPLQQEQGQSLNSVTLSGPGGSFTIDENYDDPAAIVIDQASGQVTGFLDNYDPLDQSRIAEISNKVGGTEQRVLFSRGIPDTNAWN